MNAFQLVENYSFVGDVISFLSCVVLLFVIYWVLYFAKDGKFSYLKRSLYFIMIGTLVNILFAHICRTKPDLVWLIFLLRSIYHTCFFSCLYLFMLYVKKMLDVEAAILKYATVVTRVFLLLCLIGDLLSPVTKFGFHRENGLWYDPIITPYNIFYVYGTILLFMMLFFYTDRLIKSVRNCLIVTEMIVLIIMTFCGIANINTFTSFTYVLPILVVMLLIHSKPFDDKTGSLGPDSFDSFVNQAVKKGTVLDFMVLKLDMNLVTKMPDELGKVLNSFWHNSFKDAVLFSVERDMFVLTIPRVGKNGDTEEKIRNLMNNDFEKYYVKFQIPYKVLGLFNVDFFQSDRDIKNMINYMLRTVNENSITIADDNMRDQLRLLGVIRKNLIDIERKGDLEDPRVLTYCQPIKNMSTGKYDTAEALMRLSLPENGLIPPYLFIPLAELHGHIHALTRIMLNKVCQQVKQLESEGYQFKRVSVNFAASEIKHDRFCDEILEIINRNGVAPSKIGIELTESQNESDFMIVKKKMNVLKKAGMTLYLDDVGTGYSNLDRIVRYDVDVVKFDRFFLLEAEKDSKVGHMMRHLSEAFKDLNYELLYEGVETEENEKLCLECNADYIQGFMYAKPVPMDQLRNYFDRES